MAAALADRFGEARLAAPELAHQAAIGFGFLERREIGALQILDQRDLDHLGIAEAADEDRDLVQPDALRRAPAPLAGDQLVLGGLPAHRRPHRAHQQRLHDPLAADRLRQPLQLLLGEMAARLERRGTDRLDRHRADAARADAARLGRKLRPGLAEQRRETASERRALAARPALRAAALRGRSSAISSLMPPPRAA